MAKMIVTAIGSAGDVHPLLGVARTLAARGHDVVFCTHAPFEAAVRRCGFAFVPIGTAADYEAAMANPALGFAHVVSHAVGGDRADAAPALRRAACVDRRQYGARRHAVGVLRALHAGAARHAVRVGAGVAVDAAVRAPPTHPRLTIPARWPLPVKAALMTLIERQVLDRACGPALNAVRRAQRAGAARAGPLAAFDRWRVPVSRLVRAAAAGLAVESSAKRLPLFNDIATPKTMWHSMRISRPVNPGRVHGRFDTRRSRGIRARGGGRAARDRRARDPADAARCGAGQ